MLKDIKLVKSTTKRGASIENMTSRFDGKDVFGCYGSPSYAKKKADTACYYTAADFGLKATKSYHIASHNTFFFTVAFVSDLGTHVITHAHHYLVADPASPLFALVKEAKKAGKSYYYDKKTGYYYTV